jgi:glutaredoxin 3|tara:strand:- start:902 stop:1165 length:264 start_codon:yes stop_codon:yes gene_type:complete
MAKIEIYTSPLCGFCHRAKGLLNRKNVEFEDIDVMMDRVRKAEMVERAGGRTSVPQIFIDGEHVGGCDDLYALEMAGKLDPMLEGSA